LNSKVLNASWLGASAISLPKPDQIQWNKVGLEAFPNTVKTDYFGAPSSPIAVDESAIIFGCEDRICAFNKVDKTFNLVSATSAASAKSTAWITINKVKFALIASDGKLTLFRKP
jgi:hypothetical protein